MSRTDRPRDGALAVARNITANPVGLHTLSWGLITAIALALCVMPSSVGAEPRPRAEKRRDSPPPTKSDTPPEPAADKTGKSKAKDRVKTFDFNALDLSGRMRTPQLLYFLERANEELERASLHKRSFVPHMVRSVEEENL